jgi:hypothetical protein
MTRILFCWLVSIATRCIFLYSVHSQFSEHAHLYFAIFYGQQKVLNKFLLNQDLNLKHGHVAVFTDRVTAASSRHAIFYRIYLNNV